MMFTVAALITGRKHGSVILLTTCPVLEIAAIRPSLLGCRSLTASIRLRLLVHLVRTDKRLWSCP